MWGGGILVDFLFFRYLLLVLLCIILSIILEESVAGGVVDPGVLVGAAHAGVQVEGLAGQLVGGQLAAVGRQAGRLGLGLALLLPGLKVPGSVDIARVLDPLDDLRHGDKVDIVVG